MTTHTTSPPPSAIESDHHIIKNTASEEGRDYCSVLLALFLLTYAIFQTCVAACDTCIPIIKSERKTTTTTTSQQQQQIRPTTTIYTSTTEVGRGAFLRRRLAVCVHHIEGAAIRLWPRALGRWWDTCGRGNLVVLYSFFKVL